MKRQEGVGSRAQENGMAFEDFSILTERKKMVTKVAGLVDEDVCIVFPIFSGKYEVKREKEMRKL